MKLFLSSLLLLLSSFSVSQASWTYTYTFKLLDAGGNEINADHLNNDKVRIYLPNDGSHVEGGGTFISNKNTFHVSGHTISTDGLLIIVSGNDTMTLDLATHTMNLGTFKISKGHYQIPFWGDGKHFECNKHESNCKLKQNVERYKKDGQPVVKRFEGLKQVELKLSR